MRILLGLTEVSGHYSSLKQGFRELGIKVTFWNLSGHPFSYGNEDNPFLVRWIRRIALRQKSTGQVFFLPLLASLHLVLRSILLFWSLWKFDVFIFGFNTSFLRLYDLPLLKLFGKKIIYQFHGSDSRPPYLDGSIYPPTADYAVEECIKATRIKKRTLRTIARYADVIIDNPTGGHFHERPFAIWLYVGLTSPAALAKPVKYAGPSATCVRILHCPSNPIAKGTALIEEAIDRLMAKGYAIEFVKITGRPNEEVLQELQRCDFVVDQAYSDYAMPGLATESAWFGKPVVIGGYATNLWADLMPLDDLPPSIFCAPDAIQFEIERLILDKQHREKKGRQARQFVEEHWNVRDVAQRYLKLLENMAPRHWWFDPSKVSYVHGCCAPSSWIQEMVSQVVKAGGRQALMVSDKQELERKLADFGKQAEHDSSVVAKPTSLSPLPRSA